MPGTEGTSLLQMSSHVVRTPEVMADPPVDPEDNGHEIQIEMQPVIDAFEKVDQHLFLPSYVVSDCVQLLPASRAWVDLPTLESWIEK
jgi:hypothetical protein